MKKKSLRLIAVFVVLVGSALAGLRAWVAGWINRPRLVAEMEAGWNCRAELGSTSFSLFSSPSRVVLGGLKLAPRDAEVTRPFRERAALDPSQALLSAERIELAVSLGDLLGRKAGIRRLRIEDFKLRDEIDEEGEGMLDLLFERPDEEEETEAGKAKTSQAGPASLGMPWQTARGGGMLAPAKKDAPAESSATGEVRGTDPAASGETGGETKAKSKKKKRNRAHKEHKPFKASDLKVALGADEASVENAHIDILDRGQQAHLVFDRVRLALKELDVVPDDLAHHNSCALELEGDIKLEKTDTALTLVKCSLDAKGSVKPFDVESGEWYPDLSLQLTVHQGSLLGGLLVKDLMRGKDADRFRQYGLDFGDVALGGVLGQDVTTDVHLAKGKLIVKKDTRLVFPQYQIALDGGSWFNGRADNHIARGEIVIGAELSATMLAQAEKMLAKEYGETIAGLAAQAVKSVLEDKEKRILIRFKSKGRLSKPDITWDNPLNDLKDLLKDAGASLLNGLLGK